MKELTMGQVQAMWAIAIINTLKTMKIDEKKFNDLFLMNQKTEFNRLQKELNEKPTLKKKNT